MMSEEESLAIQDLLGMEIEIMEKQEAGEKDKYSLMENHIIKVREKLKNRPSVEFPANCEWFNTCQPWTGDHLKGRLTLLDFWTYCCVNCMHILPDLEALEEAFKHNDKILVIGVHSAKFDNERIGSNISNAIQRYGIHHPVVNDAQACLWNNLSISCWPTVLLCDPDGKPLKYFVGEGHRQDMIDCVNIATEVFKDELEIPRQITLPKIEHGLHAPESVLKYPGKVFCHENLIFISDTSNHRIVVCEENGKVKHIIGDGRRGHADGLFSEAKFDSPQGLAKFEEFLFVCDTNNHVIRCIDFTKKQVTTVAGNGNQCLNSQIPSSGQNALDIPLASPWDIVLDSDGNQLFIAMAGIHQIWKYDLETKIMNLVAGSGKEENRNNSYPLKSGFAQPSGLTLFDGNLYIADSESSTIRIFHPKNGVKNICGGSKNPMDLFSYGDQDGKGTEAKLQHPLGVASIEADKLFVADSYNHKIKLVTDLAAKTPLCTTCPIEGLNEPGGLAYDGLSTLYIADTNNHCVQKLDIDKFEMEKLILEMPKSEEEVDFSKENLVLKVQKNKPFKILIKLPSEFTLNTDAPNSWKLESPTNGAVKGQISQNLTFDITKQSDEVFNLLLKLYLCSNGICTVRNKKVVFQTNEDKNDTTADNHEIRIQI